MRVRNFNNRGSTTKVIGKFPSLKTGKTVWWESQLERDFIYLLEFDSDVKTYREQPLHISYQLRGKQHSYIPDFLVERKNGQQIVEVKPASKISTPENSALFRAVGPICSEAGYEFLVATDHEIRVQPRLDNIKLLWKYSRTPIDPQHVIYCYDLIHDSRQFRLADTFTFFESKGDTRAVVYSLIYHGILRVDLMQPLTAHAQVYLCQASPDIGRKTS